MDQTVLIVLTGTVVAGFVQGLSGFAFGLVAMGIWAWSLDPVLAGPLVVFGSLIGQLLATGSMWRTMNPWRALPFVLGGIAGVPLGVVLLRYINPTGFKASVGVLLVIWCPLMLFARDLPPGTRARVPLVLAAMHLCWGAGFLTSPRRLAKPAS